MTPEEQTRLDELDSKRLDYLDSKRLNYLEAKASFSGMPAPEAMPDEGPEVRPEPLEQKKVYETYKALPQPLAEEVKGEALKIQTAKDDDLSLPKTLVAGAKNIPHNMREIVVSLGSMMGFLGSEWYHSITEGRSEKMISAMVPMIKAIKDDWGNIIDGDLGGVGEVAKRPVAQAMTSEYEEAKDKGTKRYVYEFIEKYPVDALLIGNVFKTGVGATTRMTAQTAQKVLPKTTKISKSIDSFLSTERTPLVFEMPAEIHRGAKASEVVPSVEKTIEFPRQYSKDPLTKHVFQKSFDGALEKYPSLRAAVVNHKATKVIKELRHKYDSANFTERAKMHKEVLQQIDTLPKSEQAIIVPYLEGRAQLLGQPSEQFKAFETWYRGYSDDIYSGLTDMGKITPEVAKERLYQPVAAATGQTTEQVIAEMGDFMPAYVHHTFPKTFQEKTGIHFADTTGKRFTPGFMKRSKGAAGYSEDLKEIVPKVTSEYIKFKNTEAFIGELTTNFGIPVNFKNIKHVEGGLQVGNKTFKGYKILAPDGYLRFYKGKIDFYKEVSKHLDDMQFDEAFGTVIKETLQEGVVKTTTSISGGGKLTKQGRRVEGRVREALASRGFAGGEVEQMINRLKVGDGKGLKEILTEKSYTKVTEILRTKGLNPDDVKNAFKGMKKEYTGVTKNRQVYLIPDKIAANLESYARPFLGSQKAHNVVKIAYDRPIQAWKDMVLAASPRWIKNNVMGDIIFNSIEGVGPVSYGRAFMSKYKDLIPDEIARASFAETMKYNPKLGTAAKTTVGKLIKAIDETKAVRGISKAKDALYGVNTMFEQPFVRALYLKEARTEAIRLLQKPLDGRLKPTEEAIFRKMTEIKSNPSLNGPIIQKVKETLPVFDLTGPMERMYLKRLAPFYNWYKFMAMYGAKLPAKHPFKTVGGRGIGALAEKKREDVFAEYFPFMASEIESQGIPNRFDNLWPIGKLNERGEATFFNTRGLNVFTTLEDIANFDVMNMMSPIIKVTQEQLTGKETFTGREYKTGEEGLRFEEGKKSRPPLGDHILSQFPQYKLLKQSLVPARQWDDGTIFNPKPKLDPITGEYMYPIEDVEKVLNYLGIDKRTLNIRKSFESYKRNKYKALSETTRKYQSDVESNLSQEDITKIIKKLKKDKTRWNKIIKRMEYKQRLRIEEQVGEAMQLQPTRKAVDEVEDKQPPQPILNQGRPTINRGRSLNGMGYPGPFKKNQSI